MLRAHTSTCSPSALVGPKGLIVQKRFLVHRYPRGLMMNTKNRVYKDSTEKAVRDIRRAVRRQNFVDLKLPELRET